MSGIIKMDESILIDKTTGHVLYKPYFPISAVFGKEEDYKQLMEEHSKAELYVMKNGVSEKDYDEFMRWKNRQNTYFLSNANSVCRVKGICLYDLYQIIKYEDKRNELLSNSIDYNEWNY